MSVLSTIASVIGTGINNYINKERSDDVNRQNKELLQLQNSFNVSQTNAANAYNHPMMQMKRLKEAGINPALAFTNGVSGNNMSPASASSTPTMQQAPYSSPLSQLQDAMLKDQQLKNMEQERQLTGATTKATYKNIDLTDKTMMQIDKNMQFTDSQMDLIRKQALQIDESTNKIIQEIENLRTANDGMKIENAQKELQLFFEKLTFDSRVEAEFAKNYSSVAQFKFDMLTFVERITNLKLENAKLLADIQHVNEQTKNERRRGRLLKLDYDNGKVILKINQGKESVYGNKAVHWIDYVLEKIGQTAKMAGNVLTQGKISSFTLH